jgi:hypothetical protein
MTLAFVWLAVLYEVGRSTTPPNGVDDLHGKLHVRTHTKTCRTLLLTVKRTLLGRARTETPLGAVVDAGSLLVGPESPAQHGGGRRTGEAQRGAGEQGL